MLVLSRKLQQDIVIGDNIRVTVLKVKGNTVRLGIEAPDNVRIVRGELAPANSDGQEIANVTVVFNDESEKPVDRNQSTNGVLEFTNRRQHGNSISYRQVLPQVLRHNRLKQLVREISRGNGD